MTAALLALLLAAGPADAGADPAARLAAANAAYLAGDLDAAAAGYQALLADGFEGAALHLNLGNALLRLGQRGRAVASFERALRLDPGDADARANLALARAGNVDRVVGGEETSAARALVERTPAWPTAVTLGACWALVWGLLAARLRAAGTARALLAAGALAALAGALGAGALLAAKAADARTPAAVVIAEASGVREGPELALKPAFELHAGTRLRLLERRGEAARVRLANGLEGWIRAGDLEAL